MSRCTLASLAALLAALAAPAHAALDIAGIDRARDACTDFYQYANHSWLQSIAIPDDQSRWGTFDIIAQRNEKVIVGALEEARRKPLPPQGSWERKLVEYYASGMDREAIDAAGLRPVDAQLALARNAATPADLARTLGHLHAQRLYAGFEFLVRSDAKDSTRYLAEIAQGGLGLPERDYYFDDDPRTRQIRESYRKHVARMFELGGDSAESASRGADRVVALETALARASMTAVERRDVDKTYNRMSVAELEALAPGLPWRGYFDALGAKDLASVNVAQPAYFRALAGLAAERPSEEWQAYLRWQVLHATATKLATPFTEADFDFYERQLRGKKAAPPRARSVLGVIGGNYGDEGLGHAIGHLFVDRAFPPEAKARALELVNNVKAALAERIRAIDWMSDETRARSLEKLDAMKIKIGYPDRWRDFSDARIGRHAFAENWLRGNEFDHRRFLARIGQPVDRGDWWMSPHIVNAYHNSRANEIVFPAAILQPPYFDASADDALNYGGIGMVIGHEITHGFDDRGRRFDKDGNLRDWWTPEDARRYVERAAKIERQYGGFEGVEGVKVNGKLTLGENISDVGGLKIAYLALQRALKDKPRDPIEGLTPEQRFFLSFAQAWRSSIRVEQERLYLQTDGHSPPRFRVAGPIAQLPEFAAAFSCDASKALLTESARANIW
jgi:putative endopeptidase